MLFVPTALDGVVSVDLAPQRDERGFFARSYCEREFREQGLNPRLVQCSVSFNHARGTLRGMHYQAKPHEEAKLVRCTRGSMYDVVLDLREGSPTFARWVAVELSADNHRMVYVPEGCAHGFQTLQDDTEVLYQMSEFYDPAAARGVAWDDPAFHIAWPLADPVMSPRDRSFPRLERSR